MEEFGKDLAEHFLENNPQVSCASIELVESPWNRLIVNGAAHNHAFSGGGSEKRLATVRHSRSAGTVVSGLDGLLIMKTTDSGFSNFKRDGFTTLKDTDDRIFATQLKATWRYGAGVSDYDGLFSAIRTKLLETFAGHKSKSVQQTLYAMGRAVLENVTLIDEIHLTMPNKHCLLVNLEPFGMTNPNEIFVPTDEPYGLIEATLKRS